MKPTRLLWLLASLLLAFTAFAARIEVIELQHRSAEELLALIQPHLPTTASASGTGFQLILKVEQSELAALQELVHNLDRPRRNILLTLRHGRSANGYESHAGIHGSSQGARARVYRSDSAHGERGEQKIRGIDNQPMRIDTQLLLPIREQLVWLDHGGAGSHTQTHHLELDSGLHALARLHGERVEVEIMALNRSANEPLQSRRVLTTVSGRQGEWIALASLDASRQESDRVVIYRSEGARQQAGTLWVRVQTLD